jgi:glycosyltransferase involved in cell wall biosynthesis
MKDLLSIILLSYYSKDKIRKTYSDVCAEMEKEGINFEFIIIDDGSTDESFKIACDLAEKEDNVRAFQLSRNYTSHYAIFAGMQVSHGNCLIPIPDDEQFPYHLISKMYRNWQNGEKVQIPYRSNRKDPFLSRIFSTIFYRILNLFSDFNIPTGGADSFFIDKELIDIVNARIHPIRTTSITEVLRLGFQPLFISYIRPKGNNTKSRWSFRKKITLAKDFFYSSSSFPLKLITILGQFFSGVSLLVICFYTVVKIFNLPLASELNVRGWTSIIIAISFFSGLILFSLGMISEYIWRIYEEVKARPGYIIKEYSKDINSDSSKTDPSN